MTDNMIATAIAGLALLLHLGVLVWRRAVPALNAACAALILGHLATRLGYILTPPADALLLGLIGFEILVIGAAFLALRGSLLARRLCWLAFALHAAASLLALILAIGLRFDRLF
jgi:hypothetical protein